MHGHLCPIEKFSYQEVQSAKLNLNMVVGSREIYYVVASVIAFVLLCVVVLSRRVNQPRGSWGFPFPTSVALLFRYPWVISFSSSFSSSLGSSSNVSLTAPSNIFQTLPFAGVVSIMSLRVLSVTLLTINITPERVQVNYRPANGAEEMVVSTYRPRLRRESSLSSRCIPLSSLPNRMNCMPICLLVSLC